MAQTSFLQASVGSVPREVARFKLYPKIGKVTFAFLSEPHLDNQGKASANPLRFSLQDSNDGVTWVDIGGAGFPITVAPGAQQVITIMSQKAYLRLVGQGASSSGVANKGGQAKVDYTHNGIQYFGQIDIDVTGKTGYAQDGQTETSDYQYGIGTYGASSWPTALPTVSL